MEGLGLTRASGQSTVRRPMRVVWTLIFACSCASPGLMGLDDSDAVAVAPTRPGERQTVAEKHGPPYPVVLAHGFFGFEAFAGVEQVTYFYGVKDFLAARGEREVFTPAVNPFNDSTSRGAQLIARVEDVLKETGAAKV